MGFRNDIDGGLSFWPTYIDTETNEMYTWVDDYDYVNMFGERQSRNYSCTDSKSHMKLKQAITRLNPMGNPVIVKVTPKLE